MTKYKYGNPEAPIVLIQPVGDHDLPEIEGEVAQIRKLTALDFQMIAVKVDDWNLDLSPWKAPAVFGNEDFGEGAASLLEEILRLCSDESKTYYLGGYSLAGLFSLWASYQTDRFAGIAAASPSVWFPGFLPYTFLGTGLVWMFTRNVTKALSVLMVDFSCALKLSMPLAVLSAIREASTYEITVKGGKYLEAMADATTIVFDKTGTLTKAQPTVADVVSFNGQPTEELLRIAACLEEHFPHSMAKAVVREAARKELVHEELHTKVEYIVAHGISSTLDGKKIIIGSYHFVFEDEQAQIPEGRQELFDQLPEEYSRLYMAIDGKLAAVICIEDPLREEAPEVIRQLKSLGIHKVVMMTGDSDRIAGAIAGTVGVDEYYSEVLPEDKARFVEQEKQAGHKVIMIGDGINDSPALSAADVGIAISEGAQIAREIADVTIGADNLQEVATLKELSNALMARIHKNYRMIVGINTGLIVLGVAGIIPPTTSALLHNTSTLWISTKSMKNLLDREEA